MAATAAEIRGPGPCDRLDTSLQDFEEAFMESTSTTTTTAAAAAVDRPSAFRYPLTRSDLCSRVDDTASELDLREEEEEASDASNGGYSPPAWRRLVNGDRSSGFWRGGDSLGGVFASARERQQLQRRERGASPNLAYSSDESGSDGEGVLERAIRTRLPSGSLSPEKEVSPEPGYATGRLDMGRGAARVEDDENDENDEVAVDDDGASVDEGMKVSLAALPREASENYIRFALRAEVQQRTEPLETAINFFRSWLGSATNSWASIVLSTLTVIMAYAAMRALFQPASLRPVPDLVKVAGIARSFEPLIYYSENGVQQVGELQATGVAVWDLGESVRSSNMTSAPIIVKELDELSDSLKTLAIELTKFLANVDGDVDGILIVMDWARRELSQLQTMPSPPLSTAFDNIHNMLSSVGILENARTGEQTALGVLTTSIFGQSSPQRTRQTLQRTFNEFLAVLEEAINAELQHSLGLFALFEAIDQQFLNLARTVTREASQQDDRHAELLSSLWTRILGARAADVAKYERNCNLLHDVRARTVRNKGVLVEHNHRLLALKAALEALRRKLVSPLVRSQNSSTLSLEEQIHGLEDVGSYLEAVRTRQKSKLLEAVYGGGGGQQRRDGRLSIEETGGAVSGAGAL